MFRPWIAAAAFVLASWATAVPADGSAHADSGRCGVTLVLRNPDLQEDRDGLIHAQGWFFIQFQAVGAGASDVAYFTFSFGKAPPQELNDCARQVWATGAYIQNYRGDYDPEDGFFVPINTTLVPDDQYGAAVHAFTSTDREIGRYWVRAIVDNCDGGQGSRCGDQPAQVQKHDKVVPWPIVLPGDGKQKSGVEGVTIEFAEALKSIQAWINGEPIVLEPWAGRAFDDDAVPGNDGAGGPTDPSCTGPAVGTQGCNKRVWGPAYQWKGEIDEDDVIKVRAEDLAGNVAEKIVHLLDPNAGGILAGDVIDLDMQVDASIKEVSPGQVGTFEFSFTNLGNTEAHTNLFADGPPQAAFDWSPSHIVVPPAEKTIALLHVTPDASIKDGSFHVTARAQYQSGAEVVEEKITITLVVGEGGNITEAPEEEDTEPAGEPEGGESPGATLASLLVAAVVGMGLRRRG